jgi:molybdopterin molybdotransferase
MIAPMARGPRHDLPFEEALAEVRARAIRPPAEPVPLAALVGRMLAEDLVARVANPAFTNSAMDGFAMRAADGSAPLRLVGESRAGAPFTGRVGPGEAVRISTGAVLPGGADAILRREDGDDRGDHVVARVPPRAGLHVRREGEDLAAGQVLLTAGSRVRAHHIVAVAAAGHPDAPCRRRPRVALLGSGDELVAPGEPLGPGQIYEGNLPGLAAQIRAAGAEVVSSAHVRDDRASTEAAVRRALDGDGEPPDLVVTVGGVSVGPHDHLRPALLAVGVEEIFAGIQIRPGHPLWFGRRGDQLVLGLPGNPVSAAVCLHLFGRPLLGRDEPWHRVAPLAEHHPATTTRADFIRCRWRGTRLQPLPRQGSHAVTSMAGAEAIAWIPAGGREVRAGDPVRFTPLED